MFIDVRNAAHRLRGSYVLLLIFRATRTAELLNYEKYRGAGVRFTVKFSNFLHPPPPPHPICSRVESKNFPFDPK